MSASAEFTIDQALLEDDELRTLMSGMLSGAYREELYLADVAALCRSRPLAGARLLALIERYHRLGRMAGAQYRTVRGAIEQALDLPPQPPTSPLAPEPGLQRWTLDPELTRDLSAVAHDAPGAPPAPGTAAPPPPTRPPQARSVPYAGPGPAPRAHAPADGTASRPAGRPAPRRGTPRLERTRLFAAPEEPRRASTADGALPPLLRPDPGQGPARWQEPEPPLAPGRVLHQRYELLSLLGRGGMGSVFRAVDRLRVSLGVANCEVAVKVLKPGRSAAASTAALAREFSTAQQLSHPNIVNVYDLDHDGELAFYTMELLEGVRLSELIAGAGQRLPRAQALSILGQIGAAVAHAHARGVAHGDLKPHNIMVGPGGDVRVLDFGAASVVLREPWISDGPLGDFRPATPAYASCEQLEGHQAEPRDDLYSLGCIGYLLLSGRHPFDNLSAILARSQGRKPSRPPGLDAARWKALRRSLGWTRAQRSFGVEAWLAQLGLEPRGASAASASQRDARRAHPTGPVRPARAAHAAGAARSRATAAWVLLAIGIGMAVVAVSTLRTPGVRTASAALAALLRIGQGIAGDLPRTGLAAAQPATQRGTDPPGARGTASEGHRSGIFGPAGAGGAMPSAAAASASQAADAGQSFAPSPAAASEPPHAAFLASHYEVSGDSPAAQIVIRRAGGAADRPIRFAWWTVPGSANPNVDYAALGRHVGRIAPGRASVSVFVPIISNPLRHGRSEFSVALDTLSGNAPQSAGTAPATAQSRATVTIDRGG